MRGATISGLAAAILALPAGAQERADDNAVTQAEDAFGFSVGRESLGIYSSGSTRGFSPNAAGNVRIDGLYFDSAYQLTSLITDQTSIKVGLSAQGYPFAAPSGIVDIRLNRPTAKLGGSLIVNADSFGTWGIEAASSVPVSSTLSLGIGGTMGSQQFPDGTENWNHSQSVIARWRPAKGVEITPFWMLANDYDDEAGPYYIPAGRFLPPLPKPDRFAGPGWADIRYTATNHGVVASVTPATNWLVRVGGFRSVYDGLAGWANLLVDIRPDGTARRIVSADPRAKNVALSGELRLTRSIAEGPRLHVLHLNLRERDTRRQFGGSDEIDFGPTRIDTPVTAPKPRFVFGSLSNDRVQQRTIGFAYDGRWKKVGEFSFSVARANYKKTASRPGAPIAVGRARPWLYNGTIAAEVNDAITLYAGYARGLEESGIAPPAAANRNQPLPAILTDQRDVGVRVRLGARMKAVVGVFDLRRPYFGFDSANNFSQVGDVRSRGVEFSLAGTITPRLNIVAGGTIYAARVERDAGAPGVVGPRPVGLPEDLLILNMNWRTPLVEGLALDLALSHRGKSPATSDNLLYIPQRGRVDVGGRYRFRLAGQHATLRVQMVNLFDNRAWSTNGPGVFAPTAPRYLSGYLAIDI